MASAEDCSSSSGVVSGSVSVSDNPSPGELILKKLFAQFMVSSKAKLVTITREPLVSTYSVYI